MALTWNIEQCENWNELVKPSEWAITESLIFATIFVGIRKITSENYREFYLRLHACEVYDGNLIFERGFITLDEVKRRIGLSTNASTLLRAEWNKKLNKMDSDKQKRINADKSVLVSN